MTTLEKRLKDVLRDNDRGGFTIPSPRLYPHQWAWDSAFAAIGWVHIDPRRAVAELRTLMSAQWSDGRVPHIRFSPDVTDYFPGPDFWETESSTSITQPPVWGTALRRLIEHGVDPADVRDLIEPIERSHLFFREARDPAGVNLVAVVHPWESGRDNCPAWDVPLDAVDPNEAPPFERRDTGKVDRKERPSDDHYRRYAVLVKAIARDGFGPGPFAVYDPMMTAILGRAELDLAFVQEAAGEDGSAARARGEAIRDALLKELWDPSLGRFIHRGKDRIEAHVLAGYMPLILDLPDEVQATLRKGLETHFAASWPLPSTSPSDPAFDPRCYWRGPTWTNQAWLLREHYDVRERIIELVDRHGVREYYHPETGEGLGGEHFTWTAALTLDLIRST